MSLRYATDELTEYPQYKGYCDSLFVCLFKLDQFKARLAEHQ